MDVGPVSLAVHAPLCDVDVVVAPVGDDPASVLVPPAEDRVGALWAVVVPGCLTLIEIPIQLVRHRLFRKRSTFGREVGQRDPNLL